MELKNNEILLNKRDAHNLYVEDQAHIPVEDFYETWQTACLKVEQSIDTLAGHLEQLTPQVAMGGLCAVAGAGGYFQLTRLYRRAKCLDSMRPMAIGLSMETLPSARESL